MNTSRSARHARFIALVCLAAFAGTSLTACYGKFPLTKAVYRFNGNVSENRWVQSLLMWGFIILPVYNLAMLGDAIIFNLIEFWTGDTLDISCSEELDDGTVVALQSGPDGKSLDYTITSPQGVVRRIEYVRLKGGWTAVNNNAGERVGYIYATSTGEIWFYDADHRLLDVVGRNDLPWPGAEGKGALVPG
ncbi:MAG: hypothetical protein PWP23_3037 [Candidatus Sumerlaeota bacterium]|nr:hypothetical protein [Candidatus Sumerlaeota bacterium]